MSVDPIAVALMVVAVLDEMQVPYAIGGSFASSAHGMTRATQDVDLVADLQDRHVESLCEALAPRFYIAEGAVRRAVLQRTSFNLIHLTELHKVDVFVPEPTKLARQQLARRQLVVLSSDPERRAFVVSPEDIVLQKLHWFRAGGEASERQWRDVQGVLKVQRGRLDLDYLSETARTAEILDLLERALKESTTA